MNDTPNIDELKGHVTRLKSLLDDPHPGLSTWMKMYGDEMQAISDFWNGLERATFEMKCPDCDVLMLKTEFPRTGVCPKCRMEIRRRATREECERLVEIVRGRRD